MKQKKLNQCAWVVATLLSFGASSVQAEEPMPGMDHSQMNHDQMDHSKMDPGTAKQGNAPVANTASDSHDSHASMQGGSPPPDARDPHAWSGGLRFPADRQLRLGDEHSRFSFMGDRLEAVQTRDASSGAYEVTAGYGRDYDRATFRSEGHIVDGRLEEAATDLLWSHAVSAYWDTQVGVSHDSALGLPGRTWLAAGMQGLAPYWFEVNVTAYLGDEARSALRLEAEYELLFTQRLVLQPRVEATVYGKEDIERGRGAGLSEAVLGMRLRYEIRREFAPYIGIEWVSKYGATADFARAAGEEIRETRLLAGLRFWY